MILVGINIFQAFRENLAQQRGDIQSLPLQGNVTERMCKRHTCILTCIMRAACARREELIHLLWELIESHLVFWEFLLHGLVIVWHYRGRQPRLI